MPQLDLHSYFSAATALIIGFLLLVFILHTYFLPKIAACLKFRRKFELKQQNKQNVEKKGSNEKGIAAETVDGSFLTLTQNYIIEMENIIKKQNKQ